MPAIENTSKDQFRCIGQMPHFPLTLPLRSGTLPEQNGHSVFWETFGNRDAPTIILLHGGPGGGTRPAMVQLFNPDRWHIVTIDQRGAGRSTPHAGDDVAALHANTTAHLIHDLERLRETLGLSNWHLYGSSWGTTLAVAYALKHRTRVNGMILAAVAMCSRDGLDFLYYGARRFLPDAFEHFYAPVVGASDGLEIAARYGDLLTCGDAVTELQSARAWCAWEAAVVSQDPRAQINPSYSDDRFCLGFARVVTHYFRHGAWLDRPLVEQAEDLADMEIALIHSRLDLSAPLITPWKLHKLWPRSDLTILPGGLHGTIYGPLSEAIVKAGEQMGGSE